ncbi:hypothetical protein Droror1_Dr00022337 [Drosera rotundifolia]
MGTGDKMILREVARLLGLHDATALRKRADQFCSLIHLQIALNPAFNFFELVALFDALRSVSTSTVYRSVNGTTFEPSYSYRIRSYLDSVFQFSLIMNRAASAAASPGSLVVWSFPVPNADTGGTFTLKGAALFYGSLCEECLAAA